MATPDAVCMKWFVDQQRGKSSSRTDASIDDQIQWVWGDRVHGKEGVEVNFNHPWLRHSLA